MKKVIGIFVMATTLLLATSSTALAATEPFGDMRLQIHNIGEHEVSPGEDLKFNVEFVKPAGVKITGYGTKLYSYVYHYDSDTQESTSYNQGGEWSVSSAMTMLDEDKWGTWDAVKENYSWTIPIDSSISERMDKTVTLRVRTKIHYQNLKIKKGGTIYSQENGNLIQYFKNNGNPYPTDDPTQWTLKYDPPMNVAYHSTYFGDPSKEVFVQYSLEDMTVTQGGGGGGALALPLAAKVGIGIVIAIIVIGIAVVKMRGGEEVPA